MKRIFHIKSQIALLSVVLAVIILSVEVGMIANEISGNRNTAQTELENIARQIKNDVEIYCGEVESVVDNLYGSPKLQQYFIERSPEKRFVVSQYIQDIINSTLYGNMNIATLKIFQDNYLLNTAGSNSYQDFFYRANMEYGLFDRLPEETFFTRTYIDDTTGKPYIGYIRPVWPVGAVSETDEEKKLFFLICRLDTLQKRIETVVSTSLEPEIAVAYEDTIILANRSASISTVIKEDAFFANNTSYKTYSEVLPEVGWTVYVGVPYSQIDRKSLSTLKESLIIVAFSLLILLVLTVWVTRNLTNPVTRLSKDINELYNSNPSKNNLGSYELWEIDQVASYINEMLQRIHRTNEELMVVQDRLHQSVVAKKEAELAFYQTQINPHFLYNTLECMRSIGQAYGIEEIQTIAQGMGKIFRYSVKSKDLVTVSEELDCVKEYFEIIQVRYLNRYTMKIEIPPELEKLKMPKMILQPLAENAVGHGLSGMKGGCITIKANKADQFLQIKIMDNGHGISPIQLAELNQNLAVYEKRQSQSGRHGVALDNINRRLKLDFGEEYGISLESCLGQGTCVTVTLPILDIFC